MRYRTYSISRGRSGVRVQLALAVFTLFVGVFALGALHYLALGRTAEARVLGVEEKYRGVGARRKSFFVRYAFEDQRGQTQTATGWFGPSWRGGGVQHGDD
ncbi:MAG: hypothetical protein K2W85_03385 [Phycisphaerales bacterium]|nr:hypothetical protein [Phycisphaerales bacterium]